MRRRTFLLAGMLAPLWVGAAASRPLTIAAFPSVDAILKAARPRWHRNPSVPDLSVISREYVDHHTAMVTAIATRSHLPDLMAIEASFLGRFVGSGAFEDLSKPPYNGQAYRERFAPYAFAQAINRHGKLVAIPTDIAPGALFYRSDLFERAGVAVSEATRTWEAFLDAGSRIQERTGAHLLSHARDLKDVMVRCGLRSGEGLYLDRQGRSLLQSPRFQMAFTLAREMRRKKLDANISAWSSEWTESLRRGTVATQMMGSWFAGHLANWLAPKTAGQWRSAPLPAGGQAAWGGTYYAIPRDAMNKALAWELLKLMTLDREMQIAAFRSQDAFPALRDAYSDGFFEQPIAFLGGQAARVQWRNSAAAIPAFPVHKLDPIAAEIVDTALDEVLIDNRSIDSALKEANELLERRAARLSDFPEH